MTKVFESIKGFFKKEVGNSSPRFKMWQVWTEWLVTLTSLYVGGLLLGRSLRLLEQGNSLAEIFFGFGVAIFCISPVSEGFGLRGYFKEKNINEVQEEKFSIFREYPLLQALDWAINDTEFIYHCHLDFDDVISGNTRKACVLDRNVRPIMEIDLARNPPRISLYDGEGLGIARRLLQLLPGKPEYEVDKELLPDWGDG